MHIVSFEPRVWLHPSSRPRHARNATRFLKKSARRPQHPLGRRHAWRYTAAPITAAVLALGGPVLLGSAAAAQSPSDTAVTAITAGSVQSVSSPGIALHVPADGRLNGDGFTADVTGYRFAYQVGLGSYAQQAPPGQVLVAFGVTCTEDTVGNDNDFYDGNGVRAVLVVDGTSEPLPTGDYAEPGPAYFLASVPSGSKDVTLQLSNDSFSQEFSFTKGEREGTQPEVLYASEDNWELTDQVDVVSVIRTPDPLGRIKNAAVNITVRSGNLTYFSPGANPRTPANPSEAWLVVDGSGLPQPPPGQPAGYNTLNYKGTLTGSDFSLARPGHPTIGAMIGDVGGQSDESGQGLFGGTYYFGPLPATTRTATLQIGIPNQVPAQDNFMVANEEVPVKSQPPLVHLSFAAPYHSAVVAIAGNPPPYAPKSSIVSGGSAVGIVVVVVVICALIAGYFVLRQRRLLPAWAMPTSTSPTQKRAAAAAAWLPGGSGAAARVSIADGAPTDSVVETPSEVSPSPPVPPSVSATTSRILVPVPETSALPSEGTIWILLLGPPSTLPNNLKLTPPELETAAFLACKDGKTFSGEALRAAVGVGRDEEWSARTVVTYVNGLRRKLGPEHVPDATSGGGYRLVGVSTDMAYFNRLVARSQGAQPAEAARHLTEALSLVRGRPFADVPSGTYGWTHMHNDGPSLSMTIAEGIIRSSIALVQRALDAGDHVLASWSVGKGLLVGGDNVDLARFQVAAAAIAPDSSALGRAWSDIGARFRAHAEPLPDELIDYYQSLRAQKHSIQSSRQNHQMG